MRNASKGAISATLKEAVDLIVFKFGKLHEINSENIESQRHWRNILVPTYYFT